MQRAYSLEKTLMLGKIEAGEEGGRRWDDWMASLIQCTWVWANSGKQWRTWKPGMLQPMGLQRHDWVTEQQQQFSNFSFQTEQFKPLITQVNPTITTQKGMGEKQMTLKQGDGQREAHCIHLSVQFSCSVVSDSLWPHESQHARPPCPSPTPGVYSNSCPSSRWCHPAISSSVIPFSSCPQSLPASWSFPMSQLFASGSQSIGVSASASGLPMNTQDWSPLGWTGWSPLSPRDSQESSPTP